MATLIAKRALVVTSSLATQSALETLLGGKSSIDVIGNSGDTAEIVDIAIGGGIVDAIFIEASLSAQNRSEPSGIKFGQYLRRECGFRGYLIFLGFLPKDRMELRLSLLEKGVPGSEYLQLPVSAAQLEAAGRRIRDLSVGELRNVVLAHCGLREKIRSRIHSIANRINQPQDCKTGSPREHSLLANEVIGFREDLARYELDSAVRLADKLVNIVQAKKQMIDLDRRRLLEVLDQIDVSFASAEARGVSSSSYCNSRALIGYDTMLIADDDGYPDLGLDYFIELGYSVTLVTSYDEAASTLSADPGAVFLCDQTFGDDSSAGRKLMALARREQWKLIIALSGASLEPAEVPEADAICAGPLAKLDTGARRIHQIICEWANTHP